jgi:hypothetical protein
VNYKILPAFVYTYAYVVLANPNVPQLDGFEFSYELAYTYDDAIGMGTGTGLIDDDWARTVNAIPVGGLNIGNAGAIGSGEYVVGLAAPMVSTGNVVLVTWRMRCFADDGSFKLDFYLGPSSVPSMPGGVAAITAGGTLYAVNFASGNASLPVASINGDNIPVAVEQTTFGGVKSLFR